MGKQNIEIGYERRKMVNFKPMRWLKKDKPQLEYYRKKANKMMANKKYRESKKGNNYEYTSFKQEEIMNAIHTRKDYNRMLKALKTFTEDSSNINIIENPKTGRPVIKGKYEMVKEAQRIENITKAHRKRQLLERGENIPYQEQFKYAKNTLGVDYLNEDTFNNLFYSSFEMASDFRVIKLEETYKENYFSMLNKRFIGTGLTTEQEQEVLRLQEYLKDISSADIVAMSNEDTLLYLTVVYIADMSNDIVLKHFLMAWENQISRHFGPGKFEFSKEAFDVLTLTDEELEQRMKKRGWLGKMAGKIFTADFETTTDPEDVRVWAWAICNENEKVIIDNSIESFMTEIERAKYNNKKIYFHNLAFDGVFIIDHLLKNGWEFAYDNRELRPYEFNCLVGGMGEFYSLILQFPKYKIKIYDSLKVLPMTVESMPKTFGFDDLILKGEIDYHSYRPVGHEITDEEKKYIENDVLIVMKALKFLHDIGDTKLTTSSNAMADFKSRVGDNMFSYLFPKMSPEIDDFIRQSYKGGFTYLNPRYKGKIIEGGIVLDVNSLYPSMMRNNYLPVGEPQYFEGKYEKDSLYPLYIQRIFCSFEVKKDHIPTIQIKNNYYFKANEYLESSNGERVMLTLTNIDLKLFLEHYNVVVYQWVDGFKFMQRNDVFVGYIDYWTKVKIESKETGNKGMYTLSKLKLNSLYGKFGTNPKSPTKIPILDNEGVVRWETIQGERDPVYIPMASFITAYAREKTIRDSQKHYDRYIYSDTDSIHLEGHDDPHDLEVHPTKLGAWDLEYKFKRGKYLKQKTYIDELFDGSFKTGVAGMTKTLQKKLNFDNFEFGVEFDGVLKKKTVKGGVVLIESTFKLKP